MSYIFIIYILIYDKIGNLIQPIRPQYPNNLPQIAVLHHYGCKSYEEFLWKVQRGRATINMNRSLTDFAMYEYISI